MTQETARKCCNRPSKYYIVYDCGPEEQELILCQYHYDLDPSFKQYIKKIEELS